MEFTKLLSDGVYSISLRWSLPNFSPLEFAQLLSDGVSNFADEFTTQHLSDGV